MNMTVRTLTTPLSTSAAAGFRSFYPHTPNRNLNFSQDGGTRFGSIPKPHKNLSVLNQFGNEDDFPFANSEKLDRSGIGNEISQRGKDRAVMSENIGPDQIHSGPQSTFNTKIEFEYKPIYIKVICGIWLLVAGHEAFIEVYSTATLRRAQVIQTSGRVISATGSKNHVFVATSTKEIHIYSIKTWQIVRTLQIMQPATCMAVIQDKVLAYGLGDDGYGIIFLKEDFRMYENCSGKERHKRAVAKVSLLPTFREDGFVWKVGGYTAITGGYTKKSKGHKKTACFLQSMKETE